MHGLINPPKFSLRLALWGTACAFGAALGTLKLTEFPVWSDGWRAAVLLIVAMPFAWLAVAGLVWWAQQEIRLEPEAIVVRRWLGRSFGFSGRRITRDPSVRFRVFTGGMGFSAFKIVSAAGSVTVDVALWSTTAKESLLPTLERCGLPAEIVRGSILDD
jgi:hypothetical protein